MRRYSSKNVLIAAIIASFLLALLASPIVMAGGSEGSGGQTHAGCDASFGLWTNQYSAYSACEFAGYGWMYFEYADGADVDIDFQPSTRNAGGSLTIPKVCYEAAGGFYHYGYFQVKYVEYANFSIHGLSSVGNPQYDNAGSPINRTGSSSGHNGSAIFSAGVDQKLIVNGTEAAHAVGPKSDEEAWAAYEEWRKDPASQGYVQTWNNNGGSYSGSINYFCYGPKIGSSGLKGEVKGYVGGINIPDGGTYEATTDITVVNYVDKVSREGDNLDVKVHVCYKGDDNYNHQSKYDNKCATLDKNESTSNSTSVSVNTPENTTVTICHTLTYPPKFDSEGNTSGEETAQHCMVIKRGKDNHPDEPTSCGSMDGLSYDEYEGHSEAQIIFKMNGTETKLGYKGVASHTYWARPGDRVQYLYKLCSSSEYSRKYPYDPNDIDGHDYPPRNFTTAHNPEFKITASPNNNYLFGMSPTSFSGDLNANHFISFTSPNTSNYFCNIYNGNSETSAKHYQIPAERGYTCGAASVAQTSDLGKTFYQQLQYKKIDTKKYTIPYQKYEIIGGYRDYWECGYTDSNGNYHSRTCSEWVDIWGWVNHTHNGVEPASASSQTIKGSVSVPYNYKLIPYTKRIGHTDGVVFPGSTYTTASYVATMTRQNKKVNKNYATATKPTNVIVAAFTTSSTPNSSYTGNSGGLSSANQICNKFGGDNCQTVYSSNTALNHHTDMLKGATNESAMISNGGSNVNNIMSVSVPLAEPGVKLCVAVGVSPADSHDSLTADPDDQGKALSQSGSSYYIGKPACVTIAKKPNFSTEGGDLKTNGSVRTSRSNVQGKVFGSWSEYGLVAKGDVSGMASGAAFAYTSPIYTNRNQPIAGTMVPGSKQWVCKTVHWGWFQWQECQWVYTQAQYNGGIINSASSNAGITQGYGSECTLGSQTYGNQDCDQHMLGEGYGILNSSDMNAIARKVYQKYHMNASEMQTLFRSTDGKSGLLNIADAKTINGVDVRTPQTYSGSSEAFYMYSNHGSAACVYSSDLGKYIQGQPADKQNSSFTFDGRNYNNNAPQFCNAQGMKIWRAYKSSGPANVIFTNYPSNGAVYMGGAGTSDLGMTGSATTYRNPTYIFDIDGTFVIDEDMISSNGFINNEINDNYSSLDELPTVVIFAHNIILTNRVTRLDAWLIAGINGGEGVINTCGAIYEGDTLKFIHPEDSAHNNELSADICNNSVVINGFAYAKKAILNRTFGGGGDNVNKFVQRGEVFNLRADAFYWSFYQSQRNRILTTVYSRELPTRY